MRVVVIGKGIIGSAISKALEEKGHEVVVYDISADARRSLASKGAVPVTSSWSKTPVA